jgi:FAD/FMN-containing dehydrogenase
MAGLANMLRRATGGGPPPLTTVRSWMGIFSAEVQAAKVSTVDELAALVQAGCYACVGAAHSYNGVQIVRDATAVTLKESGLKGIAYDEATHEVSVEPSVTILELKLFLLERERRLISSGNYMAQTVIGALCTGTHGYGREAVMAEGVTALEFLDGQGGAGGPAQGAARLPLCGPVLRDDRPHRLADDEDRGDRELRGRHRHLPPVGKAGARHRRARGDVRGVPL